jgi:phage tail-like protein
VPPMPRNGAPYGAFNFQVTFAASGSAPQIEAGFSDVSGLGNEINYSEYREGTFPVNTPIKIPNTNKLDQVTLKRGLVGSTDIFTWLAQVRDGAYEPRTVTITVLDEAHNAVLSLVLTKAQPAKWLGPTLAAKGGGECAMEELHLVYEGIDYQQVSQ